MWKYSGTYVCSNPAIVVTNGAKVYSPSPCSSYTEERIGNVYSIGYSATNQPVFCDAGKIPTLFDQTAKRTVRQTSCNTSQAYTSSKIWCKGPAFPNGVLDLGTTSSTGESYTYGVQLDYVYTDKGYSCASCPAGEYKSISTTGLAVCTPVQQGYYATATNPETYNAGTTQFSPLTGKNNELSGKYLSYERHVSANDDTPSPYIIPAVTSGAKYQAPCPKGYYCPDVKMTDPKKYPCPVNTFTNTVGATTKCEPCPYGSDTRGKTGMDRCFCASEFKIWDYEGAQCILQCNAGSFSTLTDCVPCEVAMPGCLMCSTGKSCTQCDEGYINVGGQCLLSLDMVEGCSQAIDKQNCKKCLSGKNPINGKCIETGCPENGVANGQCDSGIITCNDGFALNGNLCKEILCGENEYVDKNQCVSCPHVPNGLSNKGLGSHKNKTCDAITCNPGYLKTGNECIAREFEYKVFPPSCS